jgi:hypothetical protein
MISALSMPLEVHPGDAEVAGGAAPRAATIGRMTVSLAPSR